MHKYSIIAVSIVLFIVISPIVALNSITNLSVFDGGSNSNVYLYQGPVDASDKYDFGNCTYWVSLLRQKIGQPIPNTWGNAITWASRAEADGFIVDHLPTENSIMQDSNALGGLGHVAFVSSVDPETGNWTISEMNRIGFDEVDIRTLPPSDDAKYNFIH
jgi:surface antigen